MGYLSISLYHFHIPSLMFYSFQSLYLLLPYLSLFLCETFSYCSFRVHYLKHSVCLSPVALVGMLDFMRMQVASWASLMAQIVKNLPAMQETWVHPWVVKRPWRRERLQIPVFWPGESMDYTVAKSQT